ncbi:MAG: transcription termination factor Rho, partial [Deltaproteobacteria bacterium]
NKSGTRKEDLLMDKDEHKKIIEIRRAIATKDEKDAMMQFLSYLE